jgi:hypothetical protein
MVLSGCGLFGEEPAYSVSRYEGPAFGADDVAMLFSIEVEDEQLTLRGAKGDGDRRFGNNVFVITLSQWTEELPRLEDAWFGPEGGGVGKVLSDVRVDIQHWNPPELVSGVIYARLPTGPKVSERFWVEQDEGIAGN